MAGNTARLYRIEALIRSRGHASFRTLQEALEVSPATLKRDLEYLRSRLGAPIEYDRDLNAYRFGKAYAGPRHELPGLWFDEAELYSLLTAQQLLAGLDSDGLLSRHLQPLLDRIQHLLASGGGHEAAERITRVKIVTALRRAGAQPVLRTHQLGAADTPPPAPALPDAGARRGQRTRRVAAAPGALPQHLVPGRLVPPRGRAAPFCAGRHATGPGAGNRRPRTCRWRRCRRRWTRLRHLRRRRAALGVLVFNPQAASGPAAKSGTPSSRAAGWTTAATSCACPTWTTPSW
jgi:hypothetical protein